MNTDYVKFSNLERYLFEEVGPRFADTGKIAPADFTVYDTRVTGLLGAFENLGNRRFSDRLWDDYQEFLNAVRAAAPDGLSLRDKDRYLWGRSFYEGVVRDIRG